ncbi:MAG: hypothetical protein ACTS6P_02135 [Candidatus Hodgkinia cicadicola]
MGKFLKINVTHVPFGREVVLRRTCEARTGIGGRRGGKVGGKHVKWCKLRVMVQLA